MHSTGKKNNVINITLGVILLVLILMVLLLYKDNKELKAELNKITSSERQAGLGGKDKSTGLKKLHPSSIMPVTSGDISDKEKIKQLEAQISDMEAWQDYQEGFKSEEDNNMRARDFTMLLSLQIDDFAKVSNLSSDVKTKLLDMLPGIEFEIKRLYLGDNSEEDRRQEIELIIKNFYEEISEIFPDEYSAYKEYEKVETERNYINGFNKSSLMADNQLDASQVKRLISAIYDENKYFKEIQNENRHTRAPWGIEREKEEFEMKKMLFNRYIDSARNILTESQLEQFQKFLDAEILRQEINLNTMITNHTDYEKNKTDQ